MRDAIPENDNIYLDEKEEVRFQVEEVGDDFYVYWITIFLNQYSLEEPWITSVIRENIIGALVREGIEFHREAPRWIIENNQ
jgi:hypothetical protein